MKAILFDYDDTLVRTKESKFTAIKALGARFYKAELSDEQILEHWGKPFHELFRGIFQFIDSDLERVLKHYHDITWDFPMQAYADALPAVQEILQSHLVGIVTATSRSVLLPDLERLKFPVERFAVVQTSDDTQYYKPDPRVFESVLRKLGSRGVEVQDTIYIGDALTDFHAATNAGVKFLGISRSAYSAQEFEKVGAKWVNSLSSVLSEL